MTAQRQKNKERLKIAYLAILAGVCLWAGFQHAAWAALTERVVINRHTGLAISGFDPVSYFTDAQPTKGQQDFEASIGGVIWRFHNEGNRASFVANPEIYGPQFGGYDPVDVARGKVIEGRAQLWLVFGEKLYLFHRQENLDAFSAHPADFAKQADDQWPELIETLAAY
jgi:YHS domain-containing protein